MKEKKGIVYLIPTPIGNMDDLSKRVIDTLKLVDVIFCEDTRSTNILLNYLGIKKKLISSHKFNELSNKEKLLEYLENSFNIGIVSDRGTPGISDPGYILTKIAIDAGYDIISIPGPTAFVPALITSGIISQPFLFYGFLNSKSSQRKKELEQLKYERVTLIFYEAPHRLQDTINDMKNILGNSREISISREITKKYEETVRGTLSDILGKIKEVKGEFVLVVSGNNENDDIEDISIEDHINMYINNGESTMSAIKIVAKERNMKKNEVYSIYQSMKGNDE